MKWDYIPGQVTAAVAPTIQTAEGPRNEQAEACSDAKFASWEEDPQVQYLGRAEIDSCLKPPSPKCLPLVLGDMGHNLCQ